MIGMYGNFYCDIWECHRPDIKLLRILGNALSFTSLSTFPSWPRFHFIRTSTRCILSFQSKSPLQSSSSTSWCSRCEGKKTDGYFISCRFRISDYVPARDRFLRFLGFQSRACLQLFSIGRYLHSGGNDNIHSGQLVDKSYDLCYTNAWRKKRHISNHFP